MRRVRRVVAAALAIAVVGLPVTADAAVFTVNSTADGTDGTCGVVIGGCTLREAIASAVATSGRDTIGFDPTVFPPGAPGVIQLSQTLPVIADPEGTVLDGAGAGVIIEPANQMPVVGQGLVFASAAGVPLANVTVANVTVRNFSGFAITICGGAHPGCDEDVAKPTVRNVVTAANSFGVAIQGRAVTKAHIVDSAVIANEFGGVGLDASQVLTGTRIEGCTVRDNGRVGSGVAGIQLRGALGTVGTIVTNLITAHNGRGIQIESDEQVSKTKLTRVTASDNNGFGILVRAGGNVVATTIAAARAVNNGGTGIFIHGVDAGQAATTLKDVVANGNGDVGIVLEAGLVLAGGKITNASAVGNASAGIQLFAGEDVRGVAIARSFVVNNGGNGLQLMGSQNVVTGVRANGNVGAGIQLDGPGGGNTIQKCSAHANDGPAGIAVASGSTDNVIQKNVALANDGADLADLNPSCDGNTWKKNVAHSVSDPCIQ